MYKWKEQIFIEFRLIEDDLHVLNFCPMLDEWLAQLAQHGQWPKLPCHLVPHFRPLHSTVAWTECYDRPTCCEKNQTNTLFPHPHRVSSLSASHTYLGCSMSKFSSGDVSTLIGPVEVKHGGGVTYHDSSIEFGIGDDGNKLNAPS